VRKTYLVFLMVERLLLLVVVLFFCCGPRIGSDLGAQKEEIEDRLMRLESRTAQLEIDCDKSTNAPRP